MKKKELIIALILYYKEGIKNLPEIKFHEYLSEKKLSFGICWCAHAVFNTDIFEKSWVTEFCNRESAKNWNDYWCPPVGSGIKRHGVKELLQQRLEILEKIFGRYKK